MGRKIMLAVDDSQHAERAWDLYYNEVRRPDDDLILIHCAELRHMKTQPYSVDMLQEVMKESDDATKVLLTKYQKLLGDKQVVYRVLSCIGKPGEQITRSADEEKPRMIIMGTRGQSKVRRTVMGSVSNYVINHSHCPVLIARE